MLQRIQSWERVFSDFLEQRADQPFVWGSNDCCLFPADAILAMTGVDLLAEFRGTYATETGALRAILTVPDGKTVSDVLAWCASEHGVSELSAPRYAQRGDLLVMEDSGRLIGGIVHLDGRYGVSVGEDGLKTLPIECWRRAWRV